MLDFYNTKIYADKTLKEQVIETFNIDVISDKNALLYNNNNDDYINATNSPKIKCGMTLYKGKYYFFDQCLTDRLSTYSYSYSYYIYQVRNELAENILKTNKINNWLIKFESLYYYGGFYKNINIYGVKTYFFKSILEDGIMTIPYSISPLISVKKNITISDYFNEWYKSFSDSLINANRDLILRMKIQKLKEKINGELV